MKVISLICLFAIAFAIADARGKKCTGECQKADVNARMPYVMRLKTEDFNICKAEKRCPTVTKPLQDFPCTNGRADEYECKNVDLLAHVPLAKLGCRDAGNDIWGWTDPETKHEYAIFGCDNGTSFVDVTQPTEPKVVGKLPTHTVPSSWRDIKVYNNHAFIGSEASNHGMQVYNLIQLRDLSGEHNILTATAMYDEFGSSHNIVINEDAGFVYAVGSRTCTSGLHIVDVKNPAEPKFAGCFGNDGYVHDAQCVNYTGPDTRHQDKEICFCYNENTLTIVDVEDKNNMVLLSREGYQGSAYTHQGWLTKDQKHLLLDDELDELYGSNPRTRTLIWNVEDLDNPKLVNSFYSEKRASDHNLYIIGNLAYQANYCAGLRILDITEIAEGNLQEVAYFDVAPDCDTPGFNGAWSNYPYFESGSIVVSSIERGLFILKHTG